jgi:hypothetical protein
MYYSGQMVSAGAQKQTSHRLAPTPEIRERLAIRIIAKITAKAADRITGVPQLKIFQLCSCDTGTANT